VHVRDRLVILLLVCLGTVLVPVHERRVVVLVDVVMGTVRELAHRPAGVLMRDMPVVMRMDLSLVSMLVSLVADDLLQAVAAGHHGLN